MPLSERPRAGPTLPPLRCRGKLHKQPGDGHCLYHSIKHGLRRIGRSVRSAVAYRVELAVWMRPRGGTIVGSDKLEDWVRWETGGRHSYDGYLSRMQSACASQVSTEFWGGSPEIAGTVEKEAVAIWLWVPCGGDMFERQHIFCGR